jgi:hypothetical protein
MIVVNIYQIKSMSLIIEESEKQKVFRQVKHRLGAPLRKIELEDEQMCTLLEIAVEDHSSYINEWLIETQWSSLDGINLDTADLTKALTTRSLGYEDSFTYAYSKLVGLQARGPWELKQDFITIVSGQQAYSVPAGRELNEVLYFQPPTIGAALFNNGFGDAGGFGGGFGQVGGYGGMGMGGFGGGGFFLSPSFDLVLRNSDYNLKQRLISSELTYNVIGGPNGTKIIRLISTPGSSLSFGGSLSGGRNVTGSKVWYWYYETTSDEDRQRCLNANKDIVKLPSDVPVDVVNFTELNSPSKQWVRDYFTALCKETLGRVRGKFGGALGVTDAEVTMDYESLLSESKEDKTALMTRLDERLKRLSPDQMLTRKATEAEQLNKALQYRPLGITVI